MLAQNIARKAVRSYLTGVAAPRRVGAVRGGLLGFLLGVTSTGAALYYYILDEYKTANNVVVADVAALQSLILLLEKHVKQLERK